MINIMVNKKNIVSGIIMLFFLLFAGGLYAYDPAADEKADSYRTGSIDPKSLELPYSVEWLLEFDPSEGIEQTVRFLSEDTDDPFRMVKRFHDWIVSFIAFDEESFFQNETKRLSPEQIVRQKRTVSEGFARLFIQMCDLAGINAMVIRGVTNRYYIGEDNPVPHYWNAVELGGIWYVVDTAEDARSSLYSDMELFIAPEAKILRHLPDDDRYQFLEEPVSREHFLKQPLWEYNMVRYGIRPGEGFEKRTVTFAGPEGGSVTRRWDLISTDRSVCSLRFTKPDQVYYLPVLRDASGKIYPHHAFAFVETSASVSEGVIQFSIPPSRSGETSPFYEATIFAGDIKTGEKQLLYRFYLKEDMPIDMSLKDTRARARQLSQEDVKLPRFPLLPGKDRMYPTPWLSFYSCVLEQEGSELQQFGAYKVITLSFPEEVEVQATLETPGGQKIEGGVRSSYNGTNQLRYFFSAPKPGRYFVKIEGRKKNEKAVFHSLLETSFYEYQPTQPREAPPHVPDFTEHYYSAGFHLLRDNFHRVAQEGCYRLVFSSPEEYRMECALLNADGEELPGKSVYERHDTVYYFYFTPAGTGEKAVIYSMDENNKKKTVCTLSFDPALQWVTSGKYAYEEGWLYEKNGCKDFGIELTYENIHREGSPGYAHVEFEKPESVHLAATYKHIDGTDFRKGNVIVSTPSAATKRYYCALPEEEPVLVTVFAAGPKEKVPRDYNTPVADFMLFPDEMNRQPIPPAGEIIFYEEFYRNGFHYLSDTMSDAVDNKKFSASPESYELQIAFPEGAALECKLFTEEGIEIQNAVRFKIRDYRYIFTINPPPELKGLSGKVFYYNREGQWQTMCWFRLPY